MYYQILSVTKQNIQQFELLGKFYSNDSFFENHKLLVLFLTEKYGKNHQKMVVQLC